MMAQSGRRRALADPIAIVAIYARTGIILRPGLPLLCTAYCHNGVDYVHKAGFKSIVRQAKLQLSLNRDDNEEVRMGI